jgi:DNA polymerase I
MNQPKKIILIDGNAILHKAYHGLPPFRTSEGELVNAVYGFASLMLNMLNRDHPEYLAVTFDLKGKTFRHEASVEYKANRTKAPDDLYGQLPRIKDIVRAFQTPIFEFEGFEADDLIGTLAVQAEEQGIHSCIVTGDMDTAQLVTEKVVVYAMHKGFKEPIVYDRNKVIERYGLQPDQVIDMKALQGDSSDNIKGVAGIGPKTAQTLLQKYKTLENIYTNLDEITGSAHTKLTKDKESAFLSQKLATIVTNVPITLDLKACETHDYDEEALTKIFQELEFTTLLNRLHQFNRKSETRRQLEKNPQPSLF